MAKRRKKIKKPILFIFILLIVLICFKIIPKNNNTLKQYSDESIKVIKENNLSSISKKDYSQTLDEVLKTNKYLIEYIDEYLVINYKDDEDFIDKINIYLQKGYSGKQVNDIFKLSKKNQEKLLELDKTDFSKYISIKNFDVNNIERYNNYLEKNNIDIKTAVTYVNINLDKEFYTDTKEVKDANSLVVLVNKYNHLPDNYKPSDLVYVDGAYGNQVPFRSVLKDSFEELQQAAKKDININLMPTTAFRNQAFQKTLYDKYVKEDGVKGADTYSARPGYSEHQTGLAIDLKNTALSNKRLTDENYDWLSKNAYKYGFIIRFPKDKENITGYQFENWHIRYVGKDVAKIIYDNKLTLEEYVDLYVTEY